MPKFVAKFSVDVFMEDEFLKYLQEKMHRTQDREMRKHLAKKIRRSERRRDIAFARTRYER